MKRLSRLAGRVQMTKVHEVIRRSTEIRFRSLSRALVRPLAFIQPFIKMIGKREESVGATPESQSYKTVLSRGCLSMRAVKDSLSGKRKWQYSPLTEEVVRKKVMMASGKLAKRSEGVSFAS